jgi:hypothetical protein
MAAGMKTRISWREKLERQDHSKIVDVPDRMALRLGSGKMLIPRPLDVDAVIRRVRKGKLTRSVDIRERLALDNSVDVTCPLTTGIFIRIAAEAAEEDRKAGRLPVTPYWRVVREDGTLHEKFPGGVNAQARRLKEEGHTIEPGSGRQKPKVRNFEKRLMKL